MKMAPLVSPGRRHDPADPLDADSQSVLRCAITLIIVACAALFDLREAVASLRQIFSSSKAPQVLLTKLPNWLIAQVQRPGS